MPFYRSAAGTVPRICRRPVREPFPPVLGPSGRIGGHWRSAKCEPASPTIYSPSPPPTPIQPLHPPTHTHPHLPIKLVYVLGITAQRTSAKKAAGSGRPRLLLAFSSRRTGRTHRRCAATGCLLILIHLHGLDRPTPIQVPRSTAALGRKEMDGAVSCRGRGWGSRVRAGRRDWARTSWRS